MDPKVFRKRLNFIHFCLILYYNIKHTNNKVLKRAKMILHALHTTDSEHLEAVKQQMAKLGQPTIRVVNCGDYFKAIEGTHRLQAAADLGVAINFIVLEQDDLINSTTLDWQDLEQDQEYAAGELAAEGFCHNANIYEIDENNFITII